MSPASYTSYSVKIPTSIPAGNFFLIMPIACNDTNPLLCAQGNFLPKEVIPGLFWLVLLLFFGTSTSPLEPHDKELSLGFASRNPVRWGQLCPAVTRKVLNFETKIRAAPGCEAD